MNAPQVMTETGFALVPEITLPNGTVVPSFQVGQFHCSKDENGKAVINAAGKPWERINFHEAKAACQGIDGQLITELQYLAIAFDIVNQDINWTGGKVGEGHVYMGIHQGEVWEAQAGDYEPTGDDERTWHQLSNGQRIYHFAGNTYSWVFDDVQGDENGIIARDFAEDSPSITTPPYPSAEYGMGDYETWDWSGGALVRGGYWYSGSYAGVFYLGGWSPDYRYDYVGFRCTKSL